MSAHKRNLDTAFGEDSEDNDFGEDSEDNEPTAVPPITHTWAQLIQHVAKDVWGSEQLHPYQIHIITAFLSESTPMQ